MDKPLLSSGDVDDDQLVWNKKIALFLFLSSLKWILKIVIWLLFITWVAFIFLYPLSSVSQFITKWNDDTSATFLGSTGVVFLIYSGPILIIAFLSVPYLIISAKERQHHNYVVLDHLFSWTRKIISSSTPKRPSYCLSTFPLFVNEAVGVVSCAEFFGIVVFVFYVIWALCVYAVHGEELIAESQSSLLQVSGLSFGLIGIFCLSFLFIPIARGSIILRLIDIPFAHSTTYHVWLAHLSVLLFTLHGLSYIISWSIQGFPYLLQKILEWNESGAANLAGIMGYLASVSIWVTSLPPVRKQYFEVFFYTHQLYIAFIILLALHIGVVYFRMVAGTIFLFMLDRFLRFCQSQNTVDIVSATCFPTTEIVELVLSKPPNLQYNALSFIFLRVGEASGLQWHPFSVSSCSLVDENHLSIIIKAVGGWTTKIKEIISSMCEADELHLQPPSKLITASVEGPYGHEFPHHLKYEGLVLIAGGVGISPFLAVLSDIFHRIGRGKPCLAKNVVLVWAVKRSNEIALLSTIDVKSICPNFSCKVNLDILIYITQESEPPLEEGTIDYHKAITCYFAHDQHLSNRSNMSVLVATSNNTWFGIYLISTTIGFIILMCLLNMLYINPYSIPAGWYQGFLLLACMVSSVFIFGGLVIGLWHLWGRQVSPKMNSEHNKKRFEDKHVEHSGHLYQDLVSLSKIRYGSRPNFKDIFEYVSEVAGQVNVGVIVCGPPSLQSTVAKECRSINMNNDYQLDHPILHFHNHSFNL